MAKCPWNKWKSIDVGYSKYLKGNLIYITTKKPQKRVILSTSELYYIEAKHQNIMKNLIQESYDII